MSRGVTPERGAQVGDVLVAGVGGGAGGVSVRGLSLAGDAGDEGGGVVRVRVGRFVRAPDGVVDQTLGCGVWVAGQVAAKVMASVLVEFVGTVGGEQQPARPGREGTRWPGDPRGVRSPRRCGHPRGRR